MSAGKCDLVFCAVQYPQYPRMNLKYFPDWTLRCRARRSFSFSSPLNNQSTCHAAIGEYKEALQQADIAHQKRPEWDKPHYRRAVALLGLERCEETEKLLTKFSASDARFIREQIRVSRLPWTELSKNVLWKVVTTPSGERKNGRGGGDGEEEEMLRDLDIVRCHYRILELKTREVLHSTRWVTPIEGLMPTGESDTASPTTVTLAEYSVPDCLDFVLRRLADGGHGILRVGSFGTFWTKTSCASPDSQSMMLSVAVCVSTRRGRWKTAGGGGDFDRPSTVNSAVQN